MAGAIVPKGEPPFAKALPTNKLESSASAWLLVASNSPPATVVPPVNAFVPLSVNVPEPSERANRLDVPSTIWPPKVVVPVWLTVKVVVPPLKP